jgi:hypothetical protein
MEFQAQLENLGYSVAEAQEVVVGLSAGISVGISLEAEVEKYNRAVECYGGPVDCFEDTAISG